METNNNFTNDDNGKIAGIVSYFFILGWLISYFALYKDKKTDLGSYQLRQTLLFHIVSIVLWWVVSFIIGVLIAATGVIAFIYLARIVNLALIILWVIGFIGAVQGNKKPIPLIGDMAQNMFPGI